MPGGFDGRHVVITGGDGALGAAVVDVFADAGAVCHLPVRRTEVVPPRTGVQLSSGIDLTDEDAVQAYYADLPPLAASIHLVGGFLLKPIADTSRADLDRQLAVNLTTAFLCCREAVRSMRRHGGGRIVNVGSRVGQVPVGGMAAYSASKVAVAGLTRALAEEVRRDGILVNAVLPSIIDTPANRAAMPNAQVDRWPKPEEIGRTILWLASPDNRLTWGALVPVYGES